MNIIRSRLGFKAGKQLTPEELGKVAKYFEINLVIYSFRKEIVYQTETEYQHTCKLLLTLERDFSSKGTSSFS